LDPRERKRKRLKDEFAVQLSWRAVQVALEMYDWDGAKDLTRETLDLDPGSAGVRSELGLRFGEVVAH